MSVSMNPVPARARSGGLRGAVAAEWTKVRSLRSTWLFLLTAVLLMGATAAGVGLVTHDAHASPAQPAVMSALFGVVIVVAAQAMLSVTGEYATGTMCTTLRCVPSRTRVLLAKTLTMGGTAFAAGLVLGVAGTVCGALAMDESTFHASEVAGQVLDIAVYQTLLSLLTLGIAVAVRRSAGVLTALFLLLFIVPALLEALPGAFFADLAQLMPQVAGERFLVGSTALYGPGTGLLLLTGWTAVSLCVAAAVLRRRDA